MQGYNKIITCTLVTKKETSFVPDVTEIMVSQEPWVIFPYERQTHDETV